MSDRLSFASWMALWQIRFFTLRRGTLVGTDQFGNRYYQDKKRPLHGKDRRWVLYKGEPEASKVPPEWHGWLHHGMDAPLQTDATKPWVKPHQANMTGSAATYRPPGHQLMGGKREAATGDYEAWRPE